MGQRSDARQKMVQAARQLIRERGYGATAFSDVLTLSGAPRGSVYFHFPGGKAQLGMEAAEAHAHEQIEIIDRAAGEATPRPSSSSGTSTSAATAWWPATTAGAAASRRW